MSQKFYYFSWVVIISFFGLILYFYYQITFPFNVLVVANIEEYKPSFIDNLRYLAVVEQPFIIDSNAPKTQKAGQTARFQVKFIYNFGNPPQITPLLRCDDGSIYEVPKVGEIPKLIGVPQHLNIGISDYNFIAERAKGKTCHMEFDAEWNLKFQSINRKFETEDFIVL